MNDSAPPPSNALAKVFNAYLKRAEAARPKQLDDAMRQLVAQYGHKQVRASAKEMTRLKRGRKPDPDWKRLWPVLERDAELFLAEDWDALKKRTNYQIARDYAKEFPGHNATATHRRIMGKLARHRRRFMLFAAEEMTRSAYPYLLHIRALELLAESDPGSVWIRILDRAQSELERYRKRDGEPNPLMSFGDIEEANRNAPLPFTTGLAGLLAWDNDKT